MNKTAKTPATTFRQWYEAQFNRTLPIYLRSEEKKKLVKQFEQETKLKHTA